MKLTAADYFNASKTPDPDFTKIVAAADPALWAKADLAATRLGWDMGRLYVLLTLRAVITDDALAISFQSLGQYRTALLMLIDEMQTNRA